MYDIRCCICGRFCIPADSSASYGSGDMIDPSDLKFYCTICAQREFEDCIKGGSIIDCFGLKPQWQRRAARILGYIEIKTPYFAWTVWHKAYKPIPKGCNPIDKGKEAKGGEPQM